MAPKFIGDPAMATRDEITGPQAIRSQTLGQKGEDRELRPRRSASPVALKADRKHDLAGSNRVDPDDDNMPARVLKRRNKVGKKPPMPADESRLLDVKAAAAYLSATIWFVRTLMWEKRVPFLRFGHKILFDRRDLDAFIDGNKIAVGR
jgi:excisionase family DNA binding protein